MKLVKTASGKQRIKISKKEWMDLGKKAGWATDWMQKSAQEDYSDLARDMDAKDEQTAREMEVNKVDPTRSRTLNALKEAINYSSSNSRDNLKFAKLIRDAITSNVQEAILTPSDLKALEQWMEILSYEYRGSRSSQENEEFFKNIAISTEEMISRHDNSYVQRW